MVASPLYGEGGEGKRGVREDNNKRSRGEGKERRCRDARPKELEDDTKVWKRNERSP